MWRRYAKYSLVFLSLMATVIAALGGGCGGEDESEETRVTITIGHVTDLTGPASTALKPMAWGLDDLATYYNENDLIPGVYLKVVDYDTQYDPTKDPIAWEFVKSKGADLVVCELPTTGEGLKTLAERDKIPVFSHSVTANMVDPPGWVFCLYATQSQETMTLLNWISENVWDYSKGKPKIGGVSWEEPAGSAYLAGLQAFATAHPDKCELGPILTAPMGVMSWTSEVSALMDCDIVFPPPTSVAITTFIQQYRQAGGKAQFIWSASQPAYLGMVVEALGWDGIDGIHAILGYTWWSDTGSAESALAKDLLGTYHSGEYDSTIAAGAGYLAAIVPGSIPFEVVRAAAKEVGAKNLTSQAIYDAATQLSYVNEDGQKYSYTATERTGPDSYAILRVDAAQKTLVKADPDWVAVVKE